MLLQIHENPDESFWVGMVKNGCDHFYHGTLKLIVSQEWADGVNLFFACWYNFTQIKRWLRIFGMSMVKNGLGQSGDGTLKLTLRNEQRYAQCRFSTKQDLGQVSPPQLVYDFSRKTFVIYY